MSKEAVAICKGVSDTHRFNTCPCPASSDSLAPQKNLYFSLSSSHFFSLSHTLGRYWISLRRGGRKGGEEDEVKGEKRKRRQRGGWGDITIICIIKTFVEEHLFVVKQHCLILRPSSLSLSLSAVFIVKLLFRFFHCASSLSLSLSLAQIISPSFPHAYTHEHTRTHAHTLHWCNSLSLCGVLSCLWKLVFRKDLPEPRHIPTGLDLCVCAVCLCESWL